MSARLAIFGGSPAVTAAIPEYCSTGQEEVDAAREVVSGGHLSLFFGTVGDNFLGGPRVKALESAWSARFGSRHSVSMNSASSGLIAAIGACDVGPGDEVIVSPFTMTVSASCVRVFGGTPVFADIQEDSFNLDPASVAALISPRTKAIVAVDLGGQPADYEELLALARPRGIKVIEDASQAPGAIYKGRAAGTLADIGVFSLNCHKTIQCGEGGVCCTDDDELAVKLQLIRNHGEAVVDEMPVSGAERIIGFNFRMGEIEAAIALEQLKKLDRLTRPRQEIAREYDRRLGRLEGLRVPAVRPERTHVYYIYMMRLIEQEAGISRRQLVRALAAEGAPCYEGYCRPLYMQPLYQGDWPGKNGRQYGPGLAPVAERMYHDELLFHAYLYESLGNEIVEGICTAFEKIWANRSTLAALEDDGALAVRRA